MHRPPLPLTRDLVLVGGGHSHALVLRKWGMSPLPGVRLTVINPGPTAPYSGMLPGFVAGHYQRDDLDIDLVRLARFAGARLIAGAATALDPINRTITVDGRPPIGFDVASVDVGITSEMPDLPGFAEHAIPAKPLGPFAARWQQFRDGTTPAHVAVIGGGIAGVELILAMAHALRQRNRLAQATLIDNAQALTALGPKAARQLRHVLTEQGVTLLEEAEITRIAADHIALADGRQVLSDFTTGAAGARPYRWLADSGLDHHDGYLAISDRLQTSDPQIFASGDCAHMGFDPRPKAGVYAVRQAPALYHNLQAACSSGKMIRYRPQKDYLKLISLGAKSALAEKFGHPLHGALMWRWKDHIDRTFMAKFQDLPQMALPSLPKRHADGLPEALGPKPMCGGCGAKVGRTELRTALADLPPAPRPDVTPLPGDDAALLTTGSVQQVLTTDHLRSLTSDPFTMARISAVHALGDIWAMGAAPQAATANLILPRLSPVLQQRMLSEIMAAAHQVFAETGAAIVGGHTSLGDELTIGFSITGLCPQAPITLAGARPGDALILTKPLGSGIVMAAEMAGLARGADVLSALDQMTRPQARAAEILTRAHAMTDVTGFGLIGHLMGICTESQVSAVLNSAAVPLMNGVEDLIHQGVRSSLYPDNRMIAPELQVAGRQEALFDPQTAGGLLAAVDRDQAQTLLHQLQAAGEPAALIGEVTNGAPAIILT